MLSRFVDVICLTDIAINFRSGYQDQRTKRIVLGSRKIAGHYMRWYFWIDLLSSLPDRIIVTWVRSYLNNPNF